jgi:hypothetical protein
MGNSDHLRDLMMRRTFLDSEALPGLWVALHVADPGGTGEGELRGYSRQPVVFAAAGTGIANNRAAMQFDDLPESTITHFGVWDAETRGHYLTGGPLDMGLIVPQGRSLRWREGELVLRIP